MDFKKISYPQLCIAIVALLLAEASPSVAQSGKGYQILPAPDVWYNSVDGLRVGLRLRGETPGTFGDGPHRMSTGVWLGTKFPDHPVSYYFSLTEPIPSLSDFGSEANVHLETSYRTGFQSHGLTFKKRWQAGFDETHYTELALGMRTEHRFEDSYLLYRQLWQDEWLYPFSANLLRTRENGAGRYVFAWSAAASIMGPGPEFIRTEVSFEQRIPLSNALMFRGRLYSGLASDETPPEYRFSHSLRSARRWMDSGLTRARGTIPPAWMQSGNIQVTGGASLRGYLHQDIQQLNNGAAPLYTSLSALNMELDYPNPLGRAVTNIPVVGEFIDFRSYLFFDSGTSTGLTSVEESRILADAGPGFLLSINVPDYLGKSRGLIIRYDLPLWISHPGLEEHVKFRHVIGIGAIISL
ncbi:hypothetical protein [Fodinibius sediminis]|uniref:Surface antigen n=1 Tax=Fodinibius sediminis TaxID=1214077 RepID=A0A521DC35_9BACT|nr:hypothetical protein [Fodinibius sediminis]SMO69297.1 hypothetical protein SAMN06265218_109182 [Fodinibius sediminis]